MFSRIRNAQGVCRRLTCTRSLLALALVAVCFLTYCQEASAAPGGQFVKQLLSTKYGAIGGVIVGGLLLILGILLAPLIIYAWYAEAAGIRKTKADLAVLAEKYRWFAWKGIRKRVDKAVRDIADVWATGDLSSVAPLMTPEYFGSQQGTLQRWVDEGKQIVYRLEKVGKIEPLAVTVETAEAHSSIRVLVSVDCVDYMRDQLTLEVVKGEVGMTHGFETVWCFIHRDGEWLLHGIEEGSKSLVWATTKNEIDTSYLDSVRGPDRKQLLERDQKPARTKGRSQSSAFDTTTDPPAAKLKQRLVRKPTDDDE